MKTQLANDLDEIYSGEIIEKDGLYVCPVCQKEYKRKCSATRHFEARTCFKYQDLFRGKMVEMLFYQLHQKVCALDGNKGLSMGKFRKSRQYTSIAKFYVFCHSNNVNVDDYFDYAIHEFRYDTLASALVKAAKETELRRFRAETAHEYTSEDKDERYFNANEDWLGKDTGKTIRALERGDISIDYLFNQIDFDKFLDTLSKPEFVRIEQVLERQQ